jgi:hypothetical protein
MAGMLAASFSVAGSLFRADWGLSVGQIRRTRGHVLDILCLRALLFHAQLSRDRLQTCDHGIRENISFSFSAWGFIPFTVVIVLS